MVGMLVTYEDGWVSEMMMAELHTILLGMLATYAQGWVAEMMMAEL